MKHPSPFGGHEDYPDIHHGIYSRTILGFWIYLMTDFVLFGALFATYATLSTSTFGGPSSSDLFDLPFTLIQTVIFLISTLTVGLAGTTAHRKERNPTLALFGATFILGLAFLCMEFHEFSRLLHNGNKWDASAFLSAYFTVIATHGLHVVFGLLWMIILLLPVWREGVSHVSIRRLTCLKMFWQFLNIVWVFIFSLVYLIGVV